MRRLWLGAAGALLLGALALLAVSLFATWEPY